MITFLAYLILLAVSASVLVAATAVACEVRDYLRTRRRLRLEREAADLQKTLDFMAELRKRAEDDAIFAVVDRDLALHTANACNRLAEVHQFPSQRTGEGS